MVVGEMTDSGFVPFGSNRMQDGWVILRERRPFRSLVHNGVRSNEQSLQKQSAEEGGQTAAPPSLSAPEENPRL